MGRTRGKFTNKVIYIENSGLQPIGGQYLQNVNGQLYWNGISVATLPTLAGDVAYDNSSTGLTAEDVQAALDEIFGLIPTVSVTTVRNGLEFSTNPGDETIAEFGGQLTKNTTLDLNGRTLDITHVGNNNSRIQLGGSNVTLTAGDNVIANATNIVLTPSGDLRLNIGTKTAISQNKTVQLANTTGAVSLVNKGIWFRKGITYTSDYNVVAIAGNGGFPICKTTTITATRISDTQATIVSINEGEYAWVTAAITWVGIVGTAFITSLGVNIPAATSGILTVNNTLPGINGDTITLTMTRNVTLLNSIVNGEFDGLNVSPFGTNNGNISNLGIGSSKINSSDISDGFAQDNSGVYVPYTPFLGTGNATEVMIKINLISNIPILAMPVVSSFVNQTNQDGFAARDGKPIKRTGVGFRQATYCPAGIPTTIELSYVDHRYWANQYNIGIYRNTGASDGADATVTIRGWEYQAKQLI